MQTTFYQQGRTVTRAKLEGEKSYAISFRNPNHIPRKVTNKADYDIKSGMLEKVSSNLIVYHDLLKCDLNKAMNLIAKYYGHILVTLEEEHYVGIHCHNKFIVAVKL